MTGSPKRKSLENRLRRVRVAVIDFRQAMDTPRPHDLLLIALRDKQERLWKHLEPRLSRIQADATKGCTRSLHWIRDHVDELGYVLARAEILKRTNVDAMHRSAKEASEYAARIKQAHQERDDWLAKTVSRSSVAGPVRPALPRVTIQRTTGDPMRTPVSFPTASTPPSCDHGVASEAWVRELEGVRRGGMPATVGASRTEDVIPRK